jgi:translation initiation factor 3 subunit E
MFAEKLNMDQDAAEKWIVNLIRNARLDAKIDSEKNHVLMGTQNTSMYGLWQFVEMAATKMMMSDRFSSRRYQQVIDKTKGLAFRSHVLANNIDALHHAQP